MNLNLASQTKRCLVIAVAVCGAGACVFGAAASPKDYGPWQEGLSQTSYGRFGALGYDYQRIEDPKAPDYRAVRYTPAPMTANDFGRYYPSADSRGYPVGAQLTAAAGGRMLWVGHGGYPGRGDFETPYWTAAITWAPPEWALVKRRVKVLSWIGAAMDQEFKRPDGQRYRQTVRASSAWPAIRVETPETNLILQDVTLPDTWGEQKVRVPQEFKLFYRVVGLPGGRVTGLTGQTIISGEELKSNWILLWQGGNPCEVESFPLLVVFHHRPDRIVFSHLPKPGITIERKSGVGAVNLMPFYGDDFSRDNNHQPGDPDWLKRFTSRLAKVRTGPLPPSMNGMAEDRCRRWSQILLGFPIAVKEDYAVKKDLTEVAVKNTFCFESPANDWNLTHQKLAILPPVVSLARRLGYPVQYASTYQDLDLVSYYGPLVGHIGSYTAEFRLPVPPWGEVHTIRVADPKYDYITERLSKIFAEYRPPENTVPDPKEPKVQRYKESAAQGISNHVRLSAIPFLKPEAAMEQKCISQKELFTWMVNDPEAWFQVQDPGFKHGYRMPQKFETDWTVAYTFLGLGSYAAYTGDAATIRTNWKAIQEIFSYYRCIHDWPTMMYSSQGLGAYPRSEVDPQSMGYEGLALGAQLAAQVGDQSVLEETLYILSKAAVPHLSRFHYIDQPQVFWDGICDIAFLNQQVFAGAQGWHPWGPVTVSFDNWGWGMMFIWHPATANVSSAYVRFARPQAEKILIDILPRAFPGWDRYTNLKDCKKHNRPPWGMDNLLMMQAALGCRSTDDLMQTVELTQGQSIRYGQYVALHAAEARVYPLIRGPYWYQSAQWFPKEAKLILNVQPTLPDQPKTLPISIRSERPILNAWSNDETIDTAAVGTETGISILKVTVPARIILRFGPAPVHRKFQPAALDYTLKITPLTNIRGLVFDGRTNAVLTEDGKPLDRLRVKITCDGQPVNGVKTICSRAMVGFGFSDHQGIAVIPFKTEPTLYTDGITKIDSATVLITASKDDRYGTLEFVLPGK